MRISKALKLLLPASVGCYGKGNEAFIKTVNVRILKEKPSLCDDTVNQLTGYFDIQHTPNPSVTTPVPPSQSYWQSAKNVMSYPFRRSPAEPQQGNAPQVEDLKVTAQKKNKKYFFWFFESRGHPSTDPTLMWLTGGPGCSSQLALLAENGPCKVNNKNDDGTWNTTINPYSWTSNANAFWVDQPPGTGFSDGSYDHDEKGVADDMYWFLQAFFNKYPQYNRNFFVIGESYAGHYVPAVSHRIYLGNKNNEGIPIHLKGLAIGNGLTNSFEQHKWYADMAYKSGTAPSVITKSEYNRMVQQIKPCTDEIAKCNSDSTIDCIKAVQLCESAFMGPYQQKGLNPYDMREKCENPPLCYDFEIINEFLNDPGVQSKLGVNKKWEDCDFMVNLEFRADYMRNFHQMLPDLLAEGHPVLIYAGDQDYICNWLGNYHWTLELDWPGKTGFNNAGDTPLIFNTLTEETKQKLLKDNRQPGEVGKLRTYGGFSFLQVYDAGHMVPMDQDEASLKIINAFMSGRFGEM